MPSPQRGSIDMALGPQANHAGPYGGHVIRGAQSMPSVLERSTRWTSDVRVSIGVSKTQPSSSERMLHTFGSAIGVFLTCDVARRRPKR